MAKITFTFPDDDDPILSSGFVIGFPLRSQRSTAPSSSTPSEPLRSEVDEANREAGAFDAPEESH